MAAASTIYVVDDDATLRKSLISALTSSGHCAVGYASLAEFQMEQELARPACAILEMPLADLPAEHALEALRRRSDIPTIVMGAQPDASSVIRMMKLGVLDYFEKPVDVEMLREAVYKAIAWDSTIINRRRETEEARARLARLTRRERELFSFLVGGRSYKEIAAALNISARTVEVHRKHLNVKLGKERLADLVELHVRAAGSGALCGICPRAPGHALWQTLDSGRQAGGVGSRPGDAAEGLAVISAGPCCASSP